MMLNTVRAINQAVEANVNGRGRNVIACLAEQPGVETRIIRARTTKGRLEGKQLSTGTWVVITQAWA